MDQCHDWRDISATDGPKIAWSLSATILTRLSISVADLRAMSLATLVKNALRRCPRGRVNAPVAHGHPTRWIEQKDGSNWRPSQRISP
jgi:hypothetical protein